MLPAYRELENPTSDRGIKASRIYVLLYACITITAGLVGLLMIGDKIDANFLVNLSDRGSSLGLIANISYSIFIVFHIPFVFQLAKEYMLIVYDEWANSTMSRMIES